MQPIVPSVDPPGILIRATEDRTLFILKEKVLPLARYSRYKAYFDKHYNEQPYQVVQNMMKNLFQEQRRSPYNQPFTVRFDEVLNMYVFE